MLFRLLLNDPIKMVRIAAASKLSALEREFFTEEQLKKHNEVLDEYLQTLIYTADFPTGRYNLGNFYSNKGDHIQSRKILYRCDQQWINSFILRNQILHCFFTTREN